MAIDPLQEAIRAMGDKLRLMPGLLRWHGDPPEALSEFPCGLAWANTGQLTLASDWVRGLHAINVNIYQSREVLPTAIDAAKVWPYRVVEALRADQTLGGTVAAIVWPIDYRSQPMQYGSNLYYGVAFTITLKIHSA